MKSYPALDLRHPNVDLLYAALDDFGPTAIEERDEGLRVFFLTSADRDAALVGLGTRFSASPIEVPDEDWARRSQEGLTPVTVGRITIYPNRIANRPVVNSAVTDHQTRSNPESPILNPLSLVISPSMGFGTGHHATTRLCLEALQRIEVAGKTVLDVGTGSGILALAARALGASAPVGIDIDPDAVQCANENLTLNPDLSNVTFRVADITSASLAPASIVTANLTGALLARSAVRLLALTAPDGVLILSGLMTAERAEVLAAFAPHTVIWDGCKDEWVGLAVKKR